MSCGRRLARDLSSHVAPDDGGSVGGRKDPSQYPDAWDRAKVYDCLHTQLKPMGAGTITIRKRDTNHIAHYYFHILMTRTEATNLIRTVHWKSGYKGIGISAMTDTRNTERSAGYGRSSHHYSGRSSACESECPQHSRAKPSP